MEAKTESNESGNKTQIIRWQGLIYWKESGCFIDINKNTGLLAISTNLRQRKSLSQSTHKEEHAVLSSLWSSKSLYRKDSCPLLLCRMLREEPQVSRLPASWDKIPSERQAVLKDIFFLSSKLLCPSQHLSLAKKESYPIFCPFLALPRNEGCVPKDWGSWPGESNKGNWSWAHSLAICPWTPCFSNNCL